MEAALEQGLGDMGVLLPQILIKRPREVRFPALSTAYLLVQVVYTYVHARAYACQSSTA